MGFDVLLQRGISFETVASGEGTQTLAVNAFEDFLIPDVDPSKCITMNKVGALFGAGSDQPITQASLLVNSANTVRLHNLEGFNTLNFAYSFEVIEFTGSVRVERGIDQVTPSANGGVIDLTVPDFDPDSAILFYRVMERARSDYTSVRYTAKLNNGNEIRVRNRSPQADTCRIQWEILTND